MNRVWAASIVSVLALAASLLLARLHPFGDAGLYAAKSVDAPIMGSAQAPSVVRGILSDKCADCHSNQTRAPFYGHFAPVSWLMEHDIVEAIREMNLSLWDTYPADRQQILAAKIVQQMKSRQMPPLQYRIIHRNARITDADVRIVSLWARGPQALQSDSVVIAMGDPTRGKELFEKRCIGCHALTQNHEGPRLQGVYGRTSGTVAGFAYSSALKKAHIVWDENSLDKWLTDPDLFIPGNNMDFLVSKPQERRDLIGFLKQSSSK